jgi:DNA-binding MarR family transcriptional regulator
MNDISIYLKEHFGLAAKISPLSKIELAQLPLYLKGNYDLFNGSILEQRVIWVKVKSGMHFTPDQLKKQGQHLRQLLGFPIVYVFQEIESWQKKRLIERKISFVQPNRQIFVPELLLQLNESNQAYDNTNESTSKYLTPPAQCVILYHLEVASLENISFQEIAKKVGYSTMTVSRIIKELLRFKIVVVEGKKEKLIRLKKQGKALWESILPILCSPVREVWFTDDKLNQIDYRIGGDTALSNFTMLSETNQRTYVIGKDEFRSIKESGALKYLNKKYGENRIEVWLYNPAILSNSKTVDKLSLYLSMKNEDDERVKGALIDLINEVQW